MSAQFSPSLAVTASLIKKETLDHPPPSFRYWIGVQHRLQPESRLKM
ncbi:MAG: hypothetical protein ACLFT8_07840 [Desulfovermiculus sp.]